jgi:plastocyanin
MSALTDKKKREIDEQLAKIKREDLEVKIKRRIIIPPKFTNTSLEVNYFTPRFKKILKGDKLEWVNQDSNIHHLKFYKVVGEEIEFLFDLGKIQPNKPSPMANFDFNFPRIDYLCTLHTNEIGTIIIYPKAESEMSNTQQIRFLSKIFNIKPPALWSHLGSG